MQSKGLRTPPTQPAAPALALMGPLGALSAAPGCASCGAKHAAAHATTPSVNHTATSANPALPPVPPAVRPTGTLPLPPTTHAQPHAEPQPSKSLAAADNAPGQLQLTEAAAPAAAAGGGGPMGGVATAALSSGVGVVVERATDGVANAPPHPRPTVQTRSGRAPLAANPVLASSQRRRANAAAASHGGSSNAQGETSNTNAAAEHMLRELGGVSEFQMRIAGHAPGVTPGHLPLPVPPRPAPSAPHPAAPAQHPTAKAVAAIAAAAAADELAETERRVAAAAVAAANASAVARAAAEIQSDADALAAAAAAPATTAATATAAATAATAGSKLAAGGVAKPAGGAVTGAGTGMGARAGAGAGAVAGAAGPDGPFKELMARHLKQTNALKDATTAEMNAGVNALRTMNLDRLAAVSSATHGIDRTIPQLGVGALPPLAPKILGRPPSANATAGTAKPGTPASAAGAGTPFATRAQLRKATLDQLTQDLRAEGRDTPAVMDAIAATMANNPGAGGAPVGASAAGGSSGGPVGGSAMDSNAIMAQMAEFNKKMQGMRSGFGGGAAAGVGVANPTVAASKTASMPAASMRGAVDMMKSAVAPVLGGGAAGSGFPGGEAAPDLSSIQAQQAVLAVLKSQLSGWQTVAGKFTGLGGAMAKFGETVKYMTSFADDSRHASANNRRGALLALMDRDQQAQYRRNESSQATMRADTLITWADANTSPESDSMKRFQLEFDDVVLDAAQRPIVVGRSYDPTKQQCTLACARFVPDGTRLDPTFCAKCTRPNGTPWMQTNYFTVRSGAARVRLSHDAKRVLVCGYVEDEGKENALVLAVNPDDSTFDTSFGEDGLTLLFMDGYDAATGVAFDVHPVTGQIVVLVRLQRNPGRGSVGYEAHVIVQLTPDGKLDASFPAVFLGGSAKNTIPGTHHGARWEWAARDIAWYVARGDADDGKDRTRDRILVVGSVGVDADVVEARACVVQYLPDGRPDPACSAVLAEGQPPVHGLRLAPDAASPAGGAVVAQATRVLVDAKTGHVDVAGTGFDAPHNPRGFTFLWRLPPISSPSAAAAAAASSAANGGGGDRVVVVRVPGHQLTVVRSVAAEGGDGARALVGYCLRDSLDRDSADTFIARVAADGTLVSAHRLPMVGEFYQTLNGVAFDAPNNRLVSVGWFQTGRTVFTRVACVMSTILGVPAPGQPPLFGSTRPADAPADTK